MKRKVITAICIGAVFEDDVDTVSSPSVIPPGNVQQLAGWVQEEQITSIG